jgi:hypothetical protein
VSDNWHSGNAEEDGREYRGWILGHFIEPAERRAVKQRCRD